MLLYGIVILLVLISILLLSIKRHLSKIISTKIAPAGPSVTVTVGEPAALPLSSYKHREALFPKPAMLKTKSVAGIETRSAYMGSLEQFIRSPFFNNATARPIGMTTTAIMTHEGTIVATQCGAPWTTIAGSIIVINGDDYSFDVESHGIINDKGDYIPDIILHRDSTPIRATFAPSSRSEYKSLMAVR